MISNFKTLKINLKRDLSSLPQIKVALLGDTATQLLSTSLKGIAVERGFNIEMFEADFNQVERQLLDATSELYEFDPDYIIVFQSTHKSLNSYNKIAVEKQHYLADDRLEVVKNISRNTLSRTI